MDSRTALASDHALPPRRAARPRILHVITGLETGGAERMLARVVGATRDEIDHEVVSLIVPGPQEEAVREAGARVSTLGLARSAWGALQLPLAIRRLRRQRADLIQGWMYHGNVAAALAFPTGPHDAPVLWNVRHTLDSLAEESLFSRAAIMLSRRLAHRPRRILYNSAESARRHEGYGYPADRSEVIPNGFDLCQFRPDEAARRAVRAEHGLPDDALVLGRVARDHPMKDHDTLFAAVAQAAAQQPRILLVVVGPGMTWENTAVRARAERFGVRERLRLLGPSRDIPRLVNGFDLSLSTSSRSESFPNVVGESMASAVPVIATDVGDCRTIIGEADLIVPPRDPGRLAAAILRELARPRAERLAMGEKLRQRVTALYSLDSVAARYRATWRMILAGQG